MHLWIMVAFAMIVLGSSTHAEGLIERGDGRYISSRAELVADVGENIRIIIRSASELSGRIEIMADRVEKAGFEFRKLIKANDEKTAGEYAGLVSVVLENQAGVTSLLLKAPNPAPWSGTENSVQIEGRLVIPIDSRIEIECQYFDFSITGPLAEVSSQPSFGRFQLNDITEKTHLNTTGGNISARNLRGDINITGEKSDLRLTGMVADKQALITNKGGDITLSDVTGNVEVHNDYGKIKIENVRADNGKFELFGEFCPIDLGFTSLDNARIIIDNENDNVKITLPDSSSVIMNLSVGADSEIHVTKIPLCPGRIKPRHMELTAGDGGSVISADIKGVGDITVTGIK